MAIPHERRVTPPAPFGGASRCVLIHCCRRVLSGALSLALLITASSPIAAAGRERPPTQVVVATVTEQTLAARQWLPATVISLQQATIAAEQPGRLLAIAEAGSQLAQGATLFTMDGFDLRQERIVVQANIQREEARIRFLDKETSRLQRLAKTNNAAQTQLEKTAADRDVARADLLAAQARLRQVDERLQRMQPGAPFAGVIVERLKQPGEWAATGDAVLRLADGRHLEIRATVPLSSLPFLARGQMLAVEATGVRGDEGAHGQARVTYVIAAGDPESHRFTIRMDPPTGVDWAIGQVVRVAVPTSEGLPALVVPRDALVLRPAGNAVFRVGDDGRAERIPVQTGAAVGDLIEVRGDLAVGDRVIVRGAERLRPGQAVRAAQAADVP